MSVIVRSALAPVCREPTLRSEQVTQLVLGETARVDEARGEWRRVSSDHDGCGGWVHAGYLLEVDEETAAGWREQARGWSLGAEVALDGGRGRLPLRARAAIEGAEIRLPDGRRGKLVAGRVPSAAEVAAGARSVPAERWALEHFAGAPYEWGGVTPWGVDCSGLVQTTFAARGLVLPRDSEVQAEVGAPVAPESFRPGDLLFFRGEDSRRITHVAFAAEDESLIHSTVSCGGVVAESWRAGTRAHALRERLVAVRRIGRPDA